MKVATMLLKTLFAALCVIGCASAGQSPVFLWGATIESKPSLVTVPQTEFAQLMQPLLEQNTVVAFLEDDLSARDLSCHNADLLDTCYARLRKVSPKNYYASVEQPISALQTIAKIEEYNSVTNDGKLAKPIEKENGKVVFVSFSDAKKQERGTVLEGHDMAVDQISRELAGNTVFLYLSSPVSTTAKTRKRRQAVSSSPVDGGSLFQSGNQFMLYFTDFKYTSSDGTAESPDFNSMNIQTVNDSDFTVTLSSASGKSLTFNVYQLAGYFYVNDVTYENVKFRSESINAPVDFSYHCGNTTLRAVSLPTSPNSAFIQWNNLQMQAPFGSIPTGSTFSAFGEAWDCVYFFTPGILSALFTSIFLLAILFMGVCWMMDINTMDRFEDPKGKTITVNTGGAE